MSVQYLSPLDKLLELVDHGCEGALGSTYPASEALAIEIQDLVAKVEADECLKLPKGPGLLREGAALCSYWGDPHKWTAALWAFLVFQDAPVKVFEAWKDFPCPSGAGCSSN